MKRKILVFVLIFLLILMSVPSIAAEQPVVYKSVITVTEDGGRFQVGFVNLEFKKDFLDAEKLPVTFDVEVSAINGIAGVEIGPNTPDFYKSVHMSVDSYKGLLYDKAAGKNVLVDVKKQQIKAGHFSRYAFS